MAGESGEVYVLRATDDGGEWMRPTPVESAVVATVCDETDLDDEDVDVLDAYVDVEELREVLGDGNRETTAFVVEGHSVTVHADGTIDVE